MAARFAVAAALMSFVLPISGCSFSYQLGSLFGKDKDEGPEHTGSITPRPPALAPVAEGSSDGDLIFARAAVTNAFAQGDKAASIPWENPKTGARGTVTPLATAYDQDGQQCRDFLASYVRASGSEAWLQGEACRAQKGKWEVRSMRPWKRT